MLVFISVHSTNTIYKTDAFNVINQMAKQYKIIKTELIVLI